MIELDGQLLNDISLGFAKSGGVNGTLYSLSVIQGNGLSPKTATLVAVISELRKSGRTNEAKAVLEELKEEFALLFPLNHTEGYEELEIQLLFIVDVRDVAEPMILVYERPKEEDRNICIAYATPASDFVEILRKYPNLSHPQRFKEAKSKDKLSSEKSQRLGWKYRPLDETLADSIESYKQAGLVV